MAGNIYKLRCLKEDLQLLGTLNGGQSFRWKCITDNGAEAWLGVFMGLVWKLKQFDDHISYQVFGPEQYNEEDLNKTLVDYFHLEKNIKQHYSDWCSKDPIFQQAASKFYGIRLLKQDLVENIFSFICSSNNNIKRISGMIEKLCSRYGEKICDIDGKPYFAFPNVHDLAQDGVDEVLKQESFGYRAKYIHQSARIILKEGGDDWLDQLKKLPYDQAKSQLMRLSGIGAKVADCICLMSLGHLDAIPVDTHVYQIAQKFYMPNLRKQKTVTTKVYNEIGDHFRNLYGPLAGWAHTVLFCADLKQFQDDEHTGKKT